MIIDTDMIRFASFPGRRRRIAPVLLAIVAIVAISALFADRYHLVLRAQAVAMERDETTQQTRAVLRLLESELQKFRLLPVVLSEYPDLRAALRSGRVDMALNDKLAVLKARTGAGVIFVLDRRGRTVAASNADRKSTRLNSSHIQKSRMPSSA